ncbi:endo-beta-N-acetylglucosaminidase [Prevotella sp. oral taxon 317]|uniref:endo-beta-N-acetylglucosaminidase n=1 Tax=Prevotella sp. oral taxon 317 TaxID=652721 RepID=UPI0001C3FE68|nr:GEVED domain-containing protein [Prevotella sp. oral taxon 317]EFC68371.1 glycosyl hydrolase family 85 [Prevotella sp. oral taxon 317 str. F0108]
MKRKVTLSALALAGMLSAAPFTVKAQGGNTAPTASKVVYDFQHFSDIKMLQLFEKAVREGKRYPSYEELKAAGLADEIEFVRSHVRKRSILPRTDRLIKNTFETRELFMNIPAGAGRTTGGYPSSEFASDNFSMWNYTNLFGAWNHGLFQAPGSWADAAHKNGTDMMSGIKFFDTTGNPGGVDAGGWLPILKEKNADGSFKYAKPMIYMLQYLGLDGINYNWEAPNYDDPQVIAFHQKLYEIAKEEKFDNFHIAIYTLNNSLTTRNVEALYGKDKKKTADVMLNYVSDDFTYGMRTSVAQAKAAMGTADGVYAGVWIVTMNRSWTRLNSAPECGVCLWGEHAQSRFWSYNAGGDADEMMVNYQKLLERGFSGGNRNPLSRPAVNDRGHNWEESNGVQPLSTFPGMATWIPERTTITGNLPFSTHFNMGAGSQYHYKGKKTAGSWYNMSNQDIVPTYRWLVVEGNTNNHSDKVDPEITYKDAYMGGSCLLLNGKGQASSTDIVLYKTDIAGSNGAITANVAIKSGKEVPAESNLYLIVHLKNSNEWKEYAVGGTTGKTWEEKKIALNDITSGTAIDKIGLRVKNSTNSYKMMIGKLELVDGFTAAPSGVKNVAIQVKEETKSSLSVKATWAVDKAETTTGMIYNDDANIDHFEILLKDGTNGRVSEVARTSQWAAYVGNIDLKSFTNNPFIGVRAVSKDLKSYSPVVWTEVVRANANELPELVLNPYTSPELDTDADGYKTAQAIRYVEIFKTEGGSTNIDYKATGPTGGTNYVDVTDQVLTIGQGQTVTLKFKGFEATDEKNGSHDDLRYCFGRGWIDLNGDHRFDPRELTVNPKEGEQLFTIGELRKGVPDQVQKIVTKTFTIPADARIGDTRMRIVFSDAWFKGALKPTGKFNKGFAIDFRVKITGNNPQRPVPADTRDQGLADEPAGLSTTGVSNVAVAPSQLQQEGNSLNFANVEKAWIFAADGSLVAALNNPANYNLSSLASGVYLVKMQNKNIIRTQKITVK